MAIDRYWTGGREKWGEQKECDFCGDYFLARTNRAQFCCKNCRDESYAREQRLKNEEKHPIITKICKECNKEFRTISYNEKFCSNYCKDIRAGKKNIEKWVNAIPIKRKRQNLSMQMFYELGDKPSDSALKKCRACRG